MASSTGKRSLDSEVDTEVASARVAKKTKKNPFIWEIDIADPQPFRTMFKILSSLLDSVRVIIEPGGICIEAINDVKVCMVQSRFACAITIDEREKEEFDFCIGLDQLNKILTDAAAGHTIKIAQKQRGSEIFLYLNDPTSSSEVIFELNTLDNGGVERLKMQRINTPRGVDIDVAVLRNNCKTFTQIGATEVELSITEVKDQCFFSLKAHGNSAKGTYRYRSSKELSEDSSEECVLRPIKDTGASSSLYETELDESEVDVKYRELFYCQYLNCILKHMDKQVHLSLADSTPLVISYNLGNEKSYIQVMLAMCVKEDE
jgi:hypothetical protein